MARHSTQDEQPAYTYRDRPPTDAERAQYSRDDDTATGLTIRRDGDGAEEVAGIWYNDWTNERLRDRR